MVFFGGCVLGSQRLGTRGWGVESRDTREQWQGGVRREKERRGRRERREANEGAREGVRRAGDIKLEGCHVPLRWITR